MSAKIVNLRQARKQKARNTRQARASENAVKFGRTTARKTADTLARDRHEQHLDQLRLDPPDPDDPDGESAPQSP